jgi:hypothetical protein
MTAPVGIALIIAALSVLALGRPSRLTLAAPWLKGALSVSLLSIKGWLLLLGSILVLAQALGWAYAIVTLCATAMVTAIAIALINAYAPRLILPLTLVAVMLCMSFG